MNPYAFDRVINNILDNAIKNIQQGGEVNITLTSDISHIYLEIKDNGIGIPANEINDIFKAYFSGKKNKSNSTGLGLGLFLVKTIIENVHGKIIVQSEINIGTAITLMLPKYTPYKNDNITNFIPGNPIKQTDITFSLKKYNKNMEDKIKFTNKCKEYKLSNRESEVIIELFKGLQIKEIGAGLFISVHTIRNHIRSIYKKCKVQNRIELMNLFRE